ncbi:deoxyribonuclease IV [Natranaerobius thermophilus]|uniref:Probable endonuclease 4 n=1 Tax=Natranaerobius thermophilus (strain ATCC BAA-1301 / DSM 18059 / JW/NM-WN-LF) TaxID=457570 RepID=END4_NATTJ|nr:deoxyribonuclease IV [Natranaerobius thermophilus]B2A499.1 RecName: Full=Probable endonuclease 4; AltName: Full=Endodeoxyribonuclease IV; AltName: Full=Endonuclease IV [Natranaerobius thermophilus JW/NM-WN-LF]ACB83753.1 apurinic endonuclease Apn1 [Natranaerobius thermophilus JW/NM-WN-LF]
MRLGFHMPLSGGVGKQLNRASELGMECIQIFSGNPTSWKPGKITPKSRDLFIKKQEELQIKPLVFHTPYLINLASPKNDIREKSIYLLNAALEKAKAYDAPYVVTHIGSHVGEGVEKGIDLVSYSLEKIMEDWPEGVELLLENTSGAGSTLGGSLTELKKIIDKFSGTQVLGCCFDTAHAWGAGYDISNVKEVETTLELVNEQLGLDLIKVCHANDTNVPLGSTKDRHQHIGEGNITDEGFGALLTHDSFTPKAVIMETPKNGTDCDQINLQRLKKVVGRHEEE